MKKFLLIMIVLTTLCLCSCRGTSFTKKEISISSNDLSSTVTVENNISSNEKDSSKTSYIIEIPMKKYKNKSEFSGVLKELTKDFKNFPIPKKEYVQLNHLYEDFGIKYDFVELEYNYSGSEKEFVPKSLTVYWDKGKEKGISYCNETWAGEFSKEEKNDTLNSTNYYEKKIYKINGVTYYVIRHSTDTKDSSLTRFTVRYLNKDGYFIKCEGTYYNTYNASFNKDIINAFSL